MSILYHGGGSPGKSYWYTPNQTNNPASDLALPQTFNFLPKDSANIIARDADGTKVVLLDLLPFDKPQNVPNDFKDLFFSELEGKMKYKHCYLKWIAHFLVIVVSCGLFLSGCAKKNTYILSKDELVNKEITAEQFILNTEDWAKLEPDKEYGELYADSEGNLCFDLTDEELENWQKHYQLFWDIITYQAEQEGQLVHYDADNHVLTSIYTEDITDVKYEEEAMSNYSEAAIWLEYFTDPNNEVELTTIVKDKDGNILGQVEWPEKTGYFAELKKK